MHGAGLEKNLGFLEKVFTFLRFLGFLGFFRFKCPNKPVHKISTQVEHHIHNYTQFTRLFQSSFCKIKQNSQIKIKIWNLI